MTAKILAGVALLAMCEDVEIMRQIVERAVGNTYKSYAAVDLLHNHGLPDGKTSAATGVYLPGYGVLIQLTALMPFPEAVLQVKKGGRKTVSQWDVARRNLRGESTDELLRIAVVADSTHSPTRDQLTRRLLEVLAENGHNFRELPSNERLTVDVVFRDRKAARCAECHQVLKDGGKLVVLWSPHVQSADENAGDLHMRQKNYEKAIEAYRKALKLADEKEPDDSPSASGRSKAALYQKLGQACLGAGDFKEAEVIAKMLNRIAAQRPSGITLNSKSEQLAGQLDSPAAALPAHLIVSATKSQLDAVAEGKISRDEFAKAAQIEFLDPLEASVEEKSEKGEPSKRK
jgi:tetratricopeptide (TPR) repeat protein